LIFKSKARTNPRRKWFIFVADSESILRKNDNKISATPSTVQIEAVDFLNAYSCG